MGGSRNLLLLSDTLISPRVAAEFFCETDRGKPVCRNRHCSSGGGGVGRRRLVDKHL